MISPERERDHKSRHKKKDSLSRQLSPTKDVVKDPNHGAGAPTRERVERPASVVIDPARKNDFPPIIQLNVGGMMFSTTWETLTVRDPDSMIARMFSGIMHLRTDSEGRYFIDRDGTHFRHIMNYLRDGTFNFPNSIHQELLAEARFFQLRELISYLEGRGNHLAAGQLASKALEVLRNRKGNEISLLKDHLLTEFQRQASQGSLTPYVAIYSTENAKLYRDASDPDIRNIVINDLHQLGIKVSCQTTLSSAYAVHVFETSLHASVRHETNEKLNIVIELLKSVISTDGYGGKVMKTSTRPTSEG